MRSTLIIASLAFTVLAAPVPTSEVASIETVNDKRFTRTKDGHSIDARFTRLTHPRSEESEAEVEQRGIYRPNRREAEVNELEDVEKRQGGARWHGGRSVDEAKDDDVEKRFTRLTHPRSEAEVEEKRSGLRLNSRSAEEVEKRFTRLTHPRSEDNEEDVEKRFTRLTHPRSEDNEDNVEKRFTRLTHPRSEDNEAEVEKRYNRNNYRSVDETEAEVEKRFTRLTHPRSEDNVEKRFTRLTHPRSEDNVEKRFTRLTHPRSEDKDEVEKRGGARPHARDAEADTEVDKRFTRLTHPRSVKNTVRSVYDGVVEMIETLKTRGFNSANNFPAREPM